MSVKTIIDAAGQKWVVVPPGYNGPIPQLPTLSPHEFHLMRSGPIPPAHRDAVRQVKAALGGTVVAARRL